MKSPEQVQADVTRRLSAVWHLAVTDPCALWRTDFPLGQPAGDALTRDFHAYAALTRRWALFAAAQQVQVRTRTRLVAGTAQLLTTHLLVDDVDTAARLAGPSWVERLRRGRERAAALEARFANLTPAQRAKVVRAVDGWSDADVEVLMTAAKWFAIHDAAGLTPRQVPVPGLHAKWLNTGQHLVCLLAGRTDLGLAPAHPPRVSVTYLDPAHRTGGGRRHDTLTIGDTVTLPYQPRLVIISENKDTAVWFPALPGAASVEGEGGAANHVARLDWVAAARVFYWGDMDTDGLEILARLRATGLPVTSVLMDTAAYDRWAKFGTDVDKHGKPLTGKDPTADTANLTPGEAALYHRLCDRRFTGHRRVEQERIPFAEALAQITAAC